MRGYQVRDYLTEEEHEKLVRWSDDFWKRLGMLTADIASKFPEEIEHLIVAHLQDKCSIYGTEYEKYLAEIRERSGE